MRLLFTAKGETDYFIGIFDTKDQNVTKSLAIKLIKDSFEYPYEPKSNVKLLSTIPTTNFDKLLDFTFKDNQNLTRMGYSQSVETKL